MDELERRDLKGKFLSSKQKNTIAVLDHDHTYVKYLVCHAARRNISQKTPQKISYHGVNEVY